MRSHAPGPNSAYTCAPRHTHTHTPMHVHSCVPPTNLLMAAHSVWIMAIHIFSRAHKCGQSPIAKTSAWAAPHLRSPRMCTQKPSASTDKTQLGNRPSFIVPPAPKQTLIHSLTCRCCLLFKGHWAKRLRFSERVGSLNSHDPLAEFFSSRIAYQKLHSLNAPGLVQCKTSFSLLSTSVYSFAKIWKINGHCLGTPNPECWQHTSNCTALRAPFVTLCLALEALKKRYGTPPICTVVRLLFVLLPQYASYLYRQCFRKNISGWGLWKAPESRLERAWDTAIQRILRASWQAQSSGLTCLLLKEKWSEFRRERGIVTLDSGESALVIGL